MNRAMIFIIVLMMISFSGSAFARGRGGGGSRSRGGSGNHSIHTPRPSTHTSSGIVPSHHGPNYSPTLKQNRDGTSSQCKGQGCGSYHGGPKQ